MGELVEVDILQSFREISGFDASDLEEIVDEAKKTKAVFGEGFDVDARAGDGGNIWNGAELLDRPKD